MEGLSLIHDNEETGVAKGTNHANTIDHPIKSVDRKIRNNSKDINRLTQPGAHAIAGPNLNVTETAVNITHATLVRNQSSLGHIIIPNAVPENPVLVISKRKYRMKFVAAFATLIIIIGITSTVIMMVLNKPSKPKENSEASSKAGDNQTSETITTSIDNLGMTLEGTFGLIDWNSWEFVTSSHIEDFFNTNSDLGIYVVGISTSASETASNFIQYRHPVFIYKTSNNDITPKDVILMPFGDRNNGRNDFTSRLRGLTSFQGLQDVYINTLTSFPSVGPTSVLSLAPSASPAPSFEPSPTPSVSPSFTPSTSLSPSIVPSTSPTSSSLAPSISLAPSLSPSMTPNAYPSLAPSVSLAPSASFALNGWEKVYVPLPQFGEANNAISNDLVWQVKGDHQYQNYQGKVDILEKNTTSGIYNPFQRLEGIVSSAYFGYSLAMTPDAMILVISASGTKYDSGSESGSAYLFSRDNASDAFLEKQRLHINEETRSQGYSFSITPNGLMLAVGAAYAKKAPNADGATNGRFGSVYIFTRDNIANLFVQEQQLDGNVVIDVTNEIGDEFGNQVTLIENGNLLVVTAPFTSLENIIYAGSFYIFKRGTTHKFELMQRFDGACKNNYLGYFGVVVEATKTSLTIHVKSASCNNENIQSYTLDCDCGSTDLVCTGFDLFPHLGCKAN